MEPVRLEIYGGAALLALDGGVINPIGPDMIAALGRALDDAAADDSVRAAVLASANDKFFSIGFDLPEILAFDRAGMKDFIESFNALTQKLFSFPKPVAAAVSGHAVAGGCILALCSDVRLAAAGRNLVGLNEIRLGVPLPALTECIAREVCGGRAAWIVIEEGGLHNPEAALALGLVDGIVEPDGLRETAMEKARALAESPPGVFHTMKQSRTGRVLEAAKLRTDERNRIFLDAWFSEPTQTLLKEAAGQFVNK